MREELGRRSECLCIQGSTHIFTFLSLSPPPLDYADTPTDSEDKCKDDNNKSTSGDEEDEAGMYSVCNTPMSLSIATYNVQDLLKNRGGKKKKM